MGMGTVLRLTALLTGAATVLGVFALRFARSVLVDMFERSHAADGPFANPAVVALAVTRTGVLLTFLVAALAALATAEVVAKSQTSRLLVQVVVLLLLAALFSCALVGFFISFYIPEVHIP